MTDYLLIALIVLVLATIVTVVVTRPRAREIDTTDLEASIDALQSAVQRMQGPIAILPNDLAQIRSEVSSALGQQRSELFDLFSKLQRLVTDELSRARAESTAALNDLRNGMSDMHRALVDEIAKGRVENSGAINTLTSATRNAIEGVGTKVDSRLQQLQAGSETKLEQIRNTVDEKLTGVLTTHGDRLTQSVHTLRTELESRFDSTSAGVRNSVGALQRALSDELAKGRSETTAAVNELTASTRLSIEGIGTTVDNKLQTIQAASEAKLEQVRATVDEKLSSTLHTRLSESFRHVGDRLESVQSGLADVRSLASNVTDLRKLMTNVKTRGIWGEVQLGHLLDQMFTPDQYEANYKPRPRSGEMVEFALRLPGTSGHDSPIYLPIDSKFPVEDFQRLSEAADLGDEDAIKGSVAALEARIHECARDIRDKYIVVPATTNFAVLFLPIESLYSEVLKCPGLVEAVLRQYRVIIQGPSNFAGFAMSLLMGFRTLAIQRRSADISNLLGAVKTDFGKFSELLGKVEERLDDAKSNIGKARHRSAQIVRKLGKVEALPTEQVELLLPDPATDPDGIIVDD